MESQSNLILPTTPSPHKKIAVVIACFIFFLFLYLRFIQQVYLRQGERTRDGMTGRWFVGGAGWGSGRTTGEYDGGGLVFGGTGPYDGGGGGLCRDGPGRATGEGGAGLGVMGTGEGSAVAWSTKWKGDVMGRGGTTG